MARKSNDTIETLRNALANAQEEATNYRLRYESLLKENQELREENKNLRAEKDEAVKAEVDAATSQLRRDLRDERMSKMLVEKEKSDLQAQVATLNAMLECMTKAADNAAIKIQQLQAKPFIPTTEQRNFLNNPTKKGDKRAQEKENFDGTPESVQSDDHKDNSPKTDGKRKKKSQGRMPAKENYDCDEVIRHPLEEYFQLPEGANFKTRGGEIEKHEVEIIRYIPGRFVKHVFETATYVTADGDSHNTLPEEMRENPVKGCPFCIEMLVFILVEKYAYHSCKNNIRRKLKEMGVNLSKSTFVRYYQLAEGVLRKMYEDVLRMAVLETLYLMIDETCELVGVQDKKTLITNYFKKYLWGFLNKEKGLVQYFYDNGSRATAVLIAYLEGYIGAFTSDGYIAYKYFDKEECPDIAHYGCNTHARRLFVESLPYAHEESMTFIDAYADIFHNETLWKGLDPETRQKNRQRLTLPIFNRMVLRAERISKDEELMSRPAFKKAINYFLNQKENLRGFIFDGNAECSNNLVEQRFKAIKLDLKNCQVIGSEGAAVNAAFMHSLVESCRLNDLNPTEYLTMLLGTLGKNLTDKEKRELLPDKWRPKC